MEQYVRETVGTFIDQKSLDQAIAELEATDFPRQDISVIGERSKLQEMYGKDTVDPELLADNPEAPRGISIRPEEKTIGATLLVCIPAYFAGCAAALIVNPAAPLILISAVTAGSLIGAVAGFAALAIVSNRMLKRAEKQIRKGGLLLWVKTPGPRREKEAMDIMRKYNARHVHAHTTT